VKDQGKEKPPSAKGGDVSVVDELVDALQDVTRLESEAKGLTRIISKLVTGIFVRTAGQEWIDRIRRQEEAKTRIQEAIASKHVTDARNRERAAEAADTKQREKELSLASREEGLEAEKTARVMSQREQDVALQERVDALARRALDRQRDRLRLRVSEGVADIVLDALQEAHQQGRLLEFTPERVATLFEEASRKAIAFVERGGCDEAALLSSH
jgi:hypothetical protein